MRFVALLLVALPLAGCAVGPAVTSLVTAGVAGSVGSATGSAVAGIAAGLAVSVGVEQGVDYAERRIQDNVQRAVATAAGSLDVGQSAPWQVTVKIPFSDQSGKVEVARAFGSEIPCKDVIFTVEGDHGVYTTTVCRNDEGNSMWALGEPSVHRWGFLQ
jgi:hypothetical protein